MIIIMEKDIQLRKGIEAATGEVLIIQDADLEYDPKDYQKLLEPFKLGVADVVYGSRFIGSDKKRVLYFWHTVGNKILTLLSNIFTNLNLSDMEVGYKAFKTDIIKKLILKKIDLVLNQKLPQKLQKKI